MPAIQPARLKQQTAALAAFYDQPAVFVRDLHALLDWYTDHTHRKGQSGEPSSLVASYHAPPPVMRQVWLELALQLKHHPEAFLPLCDALWSEPNVDLQLLAAQLLGEVPLSPLDPVISRLQSWVLQVPEKRLMDGVFSSSMARLRVEEPERLLDLISSWLASSDINVQHAGLRALLNMVEQSSSEHLPTIYRILTPYIRIAPSRLRPDILAVLIQLIRSSPRETAYFFRQNLSVPDNPDTAWVIRQVLDEFPEDLRSGLRLAMKEKTTPHP